MSRLPDRTSPLRTALRFAVAAPLALVLAGVVMSLPVRDAPGIGGDSLACAVMMGLDPPTNWWVFIALFAASAALSAYALDRLFARWIGGHGQRSSIGLGIAVIIGVGMLLGANEVGFFC